MLQVATIVCSIHHSSLKIFILLLITEVGAPVSTTPKPASQGRSNERHACNPKTATGQASQDVPGFCSLPRYSKVSLDTCQSSTAACACKNRSRKLNVAYLVSLDLVEYLKVLIYSTKLKMGRLKNFRQGRDFLCLARYLQEQLPQGSSSVFAEQNSFTL